MIYPERNPQTHNASDQNLGAKISSQVQLANNPEAPQQASEPQVQKQGKCVLTRFQKILIGLFVFLALLATALSLGLLLSRKDNLTIKSTSDTTSLTFPGGSQMFMQEYELTQDYVFTEDITVKLLISAIREPTSSTRLLQEGELSQQADYNSYVTIEQAGITLIFAENQTVSCQVNVQILADYMIATEPQATTARLLQTADSNETKWDEDATAEFIQGEITKAFNEELVSGKSFDFKPNPTVEFDYNPTTSNFEIQTYNKSEALSMKMVSRRKFFKRVFKPIAKVVKKVVKPVVKVVKVAAPIVAKTAGTLVKAATTVATGVVGVAAGLTGAAMGAVSMVAEKAVGACIPKTPLKMNCDAKQVESDVVEEVVQQIEEKPEATPSCSKEICPQIQETIESVCASVEA